MDAGVAGREALRQALARGMSLQGTRGRRQGAPLVIHPRNETVTRT